MEIHQFDPTIYPLKLWVVKTEDINAVNKEFEGDNEGSFASDTLRYSDAFTARVVRKESNERGVLVLLCDNADINAAVHEAVHVASGIFSMISAEVDVDNDEPYAYLAEFAFDCIHQVLTNKFRE